MNVESMVDFSPANTKIMCENDVISINRYRLRYIGMTTVFSLLLILIPLAASAIVGQEKALSFYNTHTRERLTVIL
jgi:hypothetical protein